MSKARYHECSPSRYYTVMNLVGQVTNKRAAFLLLELSTELSASVQSHRCCSAVSHSSELCAARGASSAALPSVFTLLSEFCAARLALLRSRRCCSAVSLSSELCAARGASSAALSLLPKSQLLASPFRLHSRPFLTVFHAVTFPLRPVKTRRVL